MEPDREYFYWIDADGRLWHDGTELADPRFLDFFFRRLRPNETERHADFPFLSRCGREQNFVRAAIAPVVFQRLRDERLFYAARLQVPFEPARVRLSEEGLLWHPAPVGGHGLLNRRITLTLGERIVQEEGGFLFTWGGATHRLLPLP